LSLKRFLQFLWDGENPLKTHNNLMHYRILTSFYLITSFEHLDQKSHVGSRIVITSTIDFLYVYKIQIKNKFTTWTLAVFWFSLCDICIPCIISYVVLKSPCPSVYLGLDVQPTSASTSCPVPTYGKRSYATEHQLAASAYCHFFNGYSLA